MSLVGRHITLMRERRNLRKPSRCHPLTVSGLTMPMTRAVAGFIGAAAIMGDVESPETRADR